MAAYFKLLRPHQWIKNGFVFAAPLFAKEILHLPVLWVTSITFISFCFAASSIYVINDILDLEEDKIHPEKRLRPLASGRIRVKEAWYLTFFLAVVATLVPAFAVSFKTAGVIITYIAMNILYTLFLKHMVILDVMFIAVGFLLRILAGAIATRTIPSYWLLLCTLNLSLFLGFAKRRFELILLDESAQNHRKVLEHYSLPFLDQMISIVTASTIICYTLYTVDPRTVSIFHTRFLILTVPFVLYGLLRYLYIAYHQLEGGNPSKALVSDVPLLITVVLWVISCGVIIYLGEKLSILTAW